MIKTTLKIDGMMCGMCEAHVCDAIRKAVPSAKKIKASRTKKTATFVTEDEVDLKLVEDTIKETGYEFLGVDSETFLKRRLFG